ncbi:variant erythrocyte surface antigen-1 family protein [Babesia caballi]|uniref:Variant erythrocyte surface antigen-1 family protein n=1 Tax=Babesia caballi TaxID=5871 RepID=A0AAV4LTN3_BABCB|nr:variant erythrocyte surface antigen-1 family protein [Babesia caballi]
MSVRISLIVTLRSSFIHLSQPLFDCPSNLKEAIDWILRVTGKDGQDPGGGQKASQELAKAVTQLLEGVKDINSKITIDQNLIDNLATGLAKFTGYQSPGSSNEIGTDGIAVGGPVQNPGATSPTGYKLTYHRDNATWNSQVERGAGNAETNKTICAKIFLGCVPMIFSALSYLYWRCDKQGNGEWIGFGLTGSGPFKNFMIGNGYKVSELNDRKYGDQIVTESMKEDKFKDFKESMTKAALTAKERAEKEKTSWQKVYPNTQPAPSHIQNPTYPEFNRALQQKGAENIQRQSTDNSFSILFHISTLYFNAKQNIQSNNHEVQFRPPSTIREMLYFLAALPFSPNYVALDTHITKYFQSLVKNASVEEDYELMIPVADSSETMPGNTLSAANLKDYLTTSCSLSPTVLGIIQGDGASEKSEPWLHELYSNNAFHLMYPSGHSLFNVLSSYTYALQFQLYFLYAQCYGTYSQGGGWRGCRFGSGVNTGTLESHICSAGCDKQHQNGDHSTPPTCKHSDCSNNSPLQAFLTDNLKGFCLPSKSDPSSSNHLNNHPRGSMCHVKMGFDSKHLRQNAGTGNYIYSALGLFCGSSTSPLRQLSERLSCLTKRTPRTLGDLFGFIWHLNGQLFKTRPKMDELAAKLYMPFESGTHKIPIFIIDTLRKLKASATNCQSLSSDPTGFSRSLEAMAPSIPFLYQLFMMDESKFVPTALFDLTQHCHNLKPRESGIHHISPGGITNCEHSDSTPADLWSLYNPVWDETMHKACRVKSCGGYLEPLTLNDGATFSPSSAPAYLSWMAYLTDDLHESLSEMRDDFNNISCEHCGSQCQQTKTCHADSACSCRSVVSCAGVLPILYRHGFQFYDAYSLNGLKWENRTKSWKPDSTIQRTCANFHSQLQSVLSPDAPLAKLLESIDSFLYMFRFYFFYNLSFFWLCSLLILLYFLFYGIDVLHFQSHVHLPSSHTVPPLALLTTGKAPALTKLTYYMP